MYPQFRKKLCTKEEKFRCKMFSERITKLCEQKLFIEMHSIKFFVLIITLINNLTLLRKEKNIYEHISENIYRQTKFGPLLQPRMIFEDFVKKNRL